MVFGHVISGHDLVRQLEQLPVDRNSRPLQDAVISNCGELVRQIKGTIFPFMNYNNYDFWDSNYGFGSIHRAKVQRLFLIVRQNNLFLSKIELMSCSFY